MKLTTSGHIDVYPIGDGLVTRVRSWRVHRAFPHAPPSPHRRTSDRWKRRWQAEHTDTFAYLGATRRWTATGALIAHQRRIDQEPKP